MVTFNLSDLSFILTQIRIAEAQAGGADPASLVPHFSLPFGLRTVDGSFNNLLPGNELFGAADTLFPRMVPSNPLNLEPTGNPADGETFVGITNNNYGLTGDVVDSAPRTISNLIVDMSLNNPAALQKALELAGVADIELATAAINAARLLIVAPSAAAAASQATESAYEKALTQADDVTAQTAVAFTSLTNLLTDLAVNYTATDVADAAAAKAAVDAAVAAQLFVRNALAANPGVTPSDLIDANTLLTNLQSLKGAVDAVAAFVVDGNPVLLGTEDVAIADALSNADVLDDAAAANQATLTTSEALADTASDAADIVRDAAIQDLRDEVASHGIEMLADFSLVIPNIATDEGLSAQFNSWFTFFGQFFDHGLDLVTKGTNGTVYVPLRPDDPLITVGPDGIAGTGDEVTNPALQFIPLTRATPTLVDGVAEHENTTTSWVDQNQTYTSHASHQVFLREYAFSVDTNGDLINDAFAVSTGKLIDGANGGIGNWTEVKAQAATMLGIQLTDFDVHNVPKLVTDQFGRFIPGANGFAQIETLSGIVEGVAGGLLLPPDTIRTNHAFLNDIAHHAGPGFVDFDHDGVFDVGVDILQVADSNTGPEGLFGDDHNSLTYDDELLGAHKVTGDGRGNENIALTTVHHVFHSEHNNLAEHTKEVLLASADANVVKEWLLGGEVLDSVGLTALQASIEAINALPAGSPSEQAAREAAIDALGWDGERIFQAAKFGTEMQYQHLVFEEFARKVQPLVNLFGPYNAEIDPSIVAEFAHVVYRFGHSMLAEDVARMNPDGTTSDIGLIDAFLNPIEFDTFGTADASAGAIIRGSTRQVGNEIDEFVTGALRNNLLGLPLDLPVFNIARARDTGAPTLNEARAQFYAGTGDEQLKPYESWVDFALHAKNELSVVNFIAAYGQHAAILAATTLEEKREAATLLVLGDGLANDAGSQDIVVTIGGTDYTDRFDFLNSTGAWTAANSGLNDIDLWIGGLAEAQQPFGGLLGSTFNFVFETQMENLQDSDRFYYLNRLAGTHFLTELEGNSFAQMVINNTNLGEDGMHLPGDIFSVPNFILEVDQANQVTDLFRPDQLDIDGNPLPGEVGREDPAGGSIFNALVIRDNPNTVGPDTNYLKFTGGEHVVLGGTNPGNATNPSGNDILIASIGDDTVWGDGGDDRIEGGAGVDQLIGGAGDDIITDINGDDNFKGQGGNDVINSGDGFDLILAGDGNDFTVGGEDANETFGGEGNDYIIAGDDADIVFGDAGDDWIEGGTGNDLLQGDFGAPFQDSAHAGNDVIIGGAGSDDYDSESGDDIMLADDGIERNEGMLGFDWVTYKNDTQAANVDLFFTGLLPPDLDAIRDRFDLVEGLSGWDQNDTLRGDNADSALLSAIDPAAGFNNAINNQAQVDLVAGLQDFLGVGVTSFSGGNIILGGGGSDVIEGRGGDDILDGDAKLNVRLSIRANLDGTGAEIGTADGMTTPISSALPALAGKSLVELMFNKTLNPGQLAIVREIITDNTSGIDVAQYSDVAANYIVEGQDIPGGIPAADIDGDGFITITHSVGGVAGADGTDKVRNFELVQFADSTLILDPSITNATAVSNLVINDLTPLTPVAVGDTLSVGGTVTDADNPGSVVPFSALNFIWQVEQTPGAGDWIDLVDPVLETPFTGPTLTITTALAADILGLSLRVRANFVDAHGFPESVVSTASDPVSNLTATEGDDILTGGPGPDVIQGLGGDDIINALGGNDILIGGRLPVGLVPGDNAGNDILDGGTDTGGLGDIALFFGDPANFTFSLTPDGILEVVDNISGEEDAIINIETIRFDNNGVITDFNVADILDGSVLIGTAADETFDPVAPVGGAFITTDFGDEIDARGGVDTVNAGAGADIIGGGDGDDVIDSGGGNDVVSGGSADTTNDIRLRLGDERLLVGTSETGADTVRNDGGIETISIGQIVTSVGGPTPPNAGTVSVTTEAQAALNTLTAVDDGAGNLVLTVNAKTVTINDHFNNVGNAVELINFNGNSVGGASLGASDYTLIAAPTGTTTLNGGAGSDALFGTAAADSLNGGAGRDLLLGDANNDTLNGGDGIDILIGGAGNDAMTGGLGDDLYVVDANGDVITETALAGSGIDTVLASNTETLDANVENLTLTGNNINGTGNALANVITGSAGNNTLSGAAGNDILVGGAGGDDLVGGTGTDMLIGGAGNDDIDTGGNDGVADIVRYSATAEFGDTINNFRATAAGIDVIELSGALGVEFDDGTVDGNISFVSDDNSNNNNVAVNLNGTTEALFLDGANGEGVLNILLNVGLAVAVEFNNEFNITAAIGESALLVVNDTNAGSNDASIWRWVQADNDTDIDAGELTRIATIDNANATITTASFDFVNASAGADLLIGDDAANAISGLGGNDTILTLGGDDTVTWNVGDGHDIADGGLEGAAGDTFVVNGDGTDETFRIYARADALAAGILGLAADSEIVVTRNGTDTASVIGEFREFEEIVVNTGLGNDTVLAIGDFNPTQLAFNTITINDGGGSDTVDLSDLTSGHHIAFNANGSDDTIIGAQSQGQTGGGIGGFTLTAADLAALKALVNGQQPAGDDDVPTGVRTLDGHGNNIAHPAYGAADEPFIRITDASYGENGAVNPIHDGLDPRTISNILGAQEPGLAPNAKGANIFFMAFGQYFDHGLDFLPKGGNGQIAIGSTGDDPADLTRGTVSGYDANGVPQHLNKTSPYVDQNQAYGSHSLVGQLLREGDGSGGLGSQLFQGGLDPSNASFRLLPTLRELITEHWNNNTVFHNPDGSTVAFQTYYADLVDANGDINEAMIDGLNKNFMGSGQTLVGDANPFISVLDHYVAGDLRTNENVTLTSIHTIWARNHNFHVENLEAAGFEGTAEELFQAAKILNEGEYQRVVFGEFADMLIGGIKGNGSHGHDDYNPEATSSISHEFAAAVYRVGHSLIGQTITIVDANGQEQQVSLVDAFLNPTNDSFTAPLPPGYVPQPGFQQLGVNGIVQGIVGQQAEEVDFNLVDAVRNDLVRLHADLFSFNVARGWDVGLGTLNQIRHDLADSTDPYIVEARTYAGNLDPYTSWEDFQARNGLSEAVIEQFKAAYPDLQLAAADIAAFQALNPDIDIAIDANGDGTVKGIDRVDVWVGGLAEAHINGGMVGQTFWVVLQEQFDRLQEGDRFYYSDRLDGLDLYANEFQDMTLAEIIARNTGLENLPENIFETPDPDDDNSAPHAPAEIVLAASSEDSWRTVTEAELLAGASDADGDTLHVTDLMIESGGGTLVANGNGTWTFKPASNDDTGVTFSFEASDGEATSGAVTASLDLLPAGEPVGLVIKGNDGKNVLIGGAGGDWIRGRSNDDKVFGRGGDDALFGNHGKDAMSGGYGNDKIAGGTGHDRVDGGAGNDRIYGDSGHDRLRGGDGDDRILGGQGRDTMSGGDGNDRFVWKYASETGKTATTRDVVTDFEGGGIAGGDIIDLSGIDALAGGPDDAFTFKATDAFDSLGQIRVRVENGNTIVSGNVTGDLGADFEIEIKGIVTLTADDFSL